MGKLESRIFWIFLVLFGRKNKLVVLVFASLKLSCLYPEIKSCICKLWTAEAH